MSWSGTTLVTHVDDVAGSTSANEAMLQLGASGAVSSGSVMVPPGWLPDLLADSRSEGLDLGIHLTLTSESGAFRWRPISTLSRSSGLVDHDGYMWPTAADVRARAHPDAVEAELRAQIESSRAAGLAITHLDHHMGVALAPEFAAITVRVAADYRLPVLFPADISGYLALLKMPGGDVATVEDAREAASDAGLAVVGHFVMPLEHAAQPDARAVFEQLLGELEPSMTYLSLHCAAPGDIEAIHRDDAHWRTAEYRLFSNRDFRTWLETQPVTVTGMRHHLDRATGER